MTRVLFLSPACTDADVRRHAETIAALPRVTLVRRVMTTEDRLPFILRAAAGVFRDRHAIDLVITVGPVAMAAANIGWRGPLVHLASGRFSRTEASLGRAMARRPDFRLITSSASVARLGMTHIADVHKVRLLRPTPGKARHTRAEVRERLGVAGDAPLFHVVGVARSASGHRLGLWATSILAFRDPDARVVLTTGGPRDAFVRRFAESTAQAHAIVADPELTEDDLATAVDVAICAAPGPTEWAALAAFRDRGVPIVGLRSTWARERLQEIPALMVDEPQARAIAREALFAIESRESATRRDADSRESDYAGTEWSHLLRTLALGERV